MVSRISGTDAFTAQAPGVTSSTTSPTPPLSETSYWSANTTGQADYQRWSGITATAPWQFRRLVYVSAAATADVDLLAMRQGSDATNCLVVRLQATDKLRVVDSTGSFVYTSTVSFPHDTWYRLEGYGDASAGTGRVALFPVGSTTAVSGFDTGSITINMGGTGPTGIRLGKTSTGGTWAGKVGWIRDEFYTGTDVTAGFRGTYTGNVAPTASPTFATGAIVNLTANAADSDGTISSYAWSITSVPSGGTPTVYNSTTANAFFPYTVAGNYGIRLVVTDNSAASTTVDSTYNAPAPGTASTPHRYVWKASTSTWVAL